MCEHRLMPGQRMLCVNGDVVKLVERGPGWRCHLWSVLVLAAPSIGSAFRSSLGQVTAHFVAEDALLDTMYWRQREGED